MTKQIKLTWVAKQHRFTKRWQGQRWYSKTNATLHDAMADFLQWRKEQTQGEYEDEQVRKLKLLGMHEEAKQFVEILQKTKDPQLAYMKSASVLPWTESEYQQGVFDEKVRVAEAKTTGVITTYGVELLNYLNAKEQDLSPNRYKVLLSHLMIFNKGAEFITLGEISLEQWETIHKEWKQKVTSGKWSTSYAADLLGSVRGFFRWLEETERTPPTPKFINASIYSFKKVKKTPERFTPSELELIFAASTDQQKLYWLLMLNCGMTQSDLSELDANQIDWKTGTLTRRRGKHDHQTSDKIPTVRYVLWKECFQLLKKHGNKKGLVFLHDDGKPLCGENRRDVIKPQWDNIRKETGITKTPKVFRKSGASALGSSVEFRSWRELYLANAGNSVTDVNYDGTTDLPSEVTQHIRGVLKI
ncbi:MAG: tyrosine-type recombinase/integrase [Planctomycetaceae bacterium]|nr:tyrosine-type recombinase/integrase [Planctomycetaceae bacterium]MCB9949566.1 tyrosine-type recombinase/integrase [Planctomycetaceae bacterium]